MNRYPLWKNLLVLVVVLVGLLYALPNLYSQDPSVEISSTRDAPVDDGTAATLPDRRTAFAESVVAALSAINLLQRCYDKAWFSQLSAGKITNLRGA